MPTLPNISPDLIKAYQDQIAATGSPATIKRKSISLNRFFDWAEAEGHIEKNPIVKIPEPIQTPQIVKTEKHTGRRTYAVIGLTTALIIIVFLLTWKLGFPISFIKNLAKENNANEAQQTTQITNTIPATPAANLAWNLYAKLRLTDTEGSPQIGSQTINFKLYNSETGGTPIYTSESKTITTDADGSALISLDGVPSELFFQNNTLFLEPVIGNSSDTLSTAKRIPVSTANTTSNLGGFLPASPENGAIEKEIPIISSDGSLLLASQSPAIKATTGNFLVEGQAVTIKAADGGGGNIEINPDANGYLHFLFEGGKGNFVNAQAPNLKSGSLYYGMVPNNSTGYYLINLQSGSKLKTKFSVDAVGNTNMTGNLATGGVDRLTNTGALQNITGYSQTSGNLTVNQSAGDFVSINKTLASGEALNDVMTLTLDERGKPSTSDSDYSTLVLNRYDGNGAGAALKVNTGNAIFNGQVQLGRYSTNPNAIGAGGSIVYNTADNKAYIWDGSTWVALGTGSSSFGGSFSDLTGGTNTSAAMVVGTGSSLGFTGTGTITASDITCTGCVANSELANSGITINSGGILSGGGSVSLGGTLNLTATEADTLSTVTGRGATTTDSITVGNLTDNGLTASKGVFTDANKTLTSTGTLGADQGGTGFSTYAIGDMLYADTTGTLAKLADVATGNVLISGGVGTAPSYGKVVLGTHTSGNYVSSLAGTANQITASGSTGDITLSIPSDFRAPGTVNAVSGLYTGATAGTQRIDATGNLTNIGNINASGTINFSNLTGSKAVFTDSSKNLTSTGTVGVDQGGTGFSTYAVGDILYADTTGTLAKLADVATGNVLISGGANTAPSYGKVVLGTHTSGNYVSSLAGTANQITASGSTGDITLSVPSDFRAPGTINAVSGIYTGATAGTQRIDATGNLTNIGNITGTGGITITPAAGNNLNIALSTTGDFAVNTNQLYVDTSEAKVGIGTATPAEKLDVQGNILSSTLTGTGNRCVYADSNGVLHVKTDDCGLAGAAGDNLGDHTATENIRLNNNWLSNDGDSEGIRVDNSGNVGVGTAGPDARLDSLATTEQLRLTYTDGVTYSSFTVDNSGNLTIAPTGGKASITGDLGVNGATSADITSITSTATVFDTGVTTLSVGGAATTLNIGTTDSVTRAINIGTGNGVDTIHIGDGATGADVITIGGGTGTLAINTGDWDIGTTGDMTGIGGITMDGSFSQTGAGTFGTGTGAISLNGDTTIAANKGLTFTSGTGTITQNYSNTTGTQATFNHTNSASSGTNVSKVLSLALTGTDNATGTNAISAIDIPNVTAKTNNTYYGIVAGTGLTDILRYNGTQIISGLGILQSVGLSGTYSNALTLSSTSNVLTGTIGQATPLAGSFTTLSSDDIVSFTGTTQGIGTSNSATTFNIGTGTAGNTFNIATNDTTKDTLNIGSSKDDVIINGAGTGSKIDFANFDVATTGTVTIAAGQSYTGSGAVTVSSGGSNQALALDGSGSGAVNIGGTSTGDVNLAGGSGSTGCTVNNANGSLTCTGTISGSGVTASALKWNALTDPDGNLTLAHGATTTTMGWIPTGDLNAWTMNLVNNGASATTQNGMIINNAVAGSYTDTTTENLLLLQQNDTTDTGTTVLGNALKIDSAGSSGMTNGIQITNSAGSITDGILIADTAGGTMAEGIEFTGTFTDYIKAPNFNVSNAGLITAATTTNTINGAIINGSTQTFSANNIADSGALTIKSGTTNALTLDSGTTGTINIGTGTDGKAINLGTDDTIADTIEIGSAKDTLNQHGTININTSGSTATNIGTDTSTGIITLGRTSNTDLALNDAQWNITGAGAANFASIGAGTAGTGAFTTLSSTGNTTLGTGSSTTNTFGSGSSSVNTIGSAATPGALTLHGATTLDNTFTVSGNNLTSLGGNLTVTGTAWTATPTISGLITATSGLTSNGAVTVQNNSNLTQTGSGTFGTGTGAVSLNGDTTIAADKNLTMTAGTGSLTVNSTVTNASKTPISVAPSFTGGATDSLTYSVLNVAAFTAANDAGTDTVNGLSIGALTDPGATIASTALKIGSGWDNVLTVNGTTVINSTGQVPTGQLTGTIFSTSADSGTSTLVQADTLAINGGINGVDTSLSGDTYTINLDTTEIAGTTFGTGSGFTWTFDAGATDPTIAFGDNLLTLTAATTDVSGDLKLTGADILDTNGNEFLRFTSTASAVNELTIANAAANGVVTMAATGNDAAIALSVDSKGTDPLNLNGTATGDILIGGGSGSTGCTVTNSNGNLVCSGTISATGGVTASAMKWNALTDPDGNLALAMGANTTAWTWNSLTTGTGLTASSTSLSSGTLESLSVNSTAATGNTQKVLSIGTAGANANSTQTTYGLYTTNTHTGTASTNVGGYFSASGGTNNYGLIVGGGNVGIGTTGPLSPLSVGGSGAGAYSNSSIYAKGYGGTGDGVAIIGESDDNDGSGIGVYGYGGAQGVLGQGPTGVIGEGSYIGVQAIGTTYDFYGSTANASNYFAGNVGIGTTGPDAKLDSLATTEQLRLSYTDGTVYSSHTVDNSGNLTIDNTGTKTIIADDLQINGADILDSNGNEFLRFTSTASAVDEITIANAAANGIVTLAATGGDAAIALSIDSKGTDALNLNGTATGDIVIGGGSGSTGCTITNASGNFACSGDVTIAADKSITFTAGTGGIVANSTVTNASKDVISVVPSYTGGATNGLTYTLINVAAFAAANATGTDTVNGLEMEALTDPGATIVSTALKIGSGWDNVLTVNGTTVVDSTGKVPSTQVSGTLLSTSADSGTSTLVQADTLAINGGINGVDTSLSGDTYTINLDATEIGTTTFGAGSGFTWTFNAGATDPTIAFASDLVTITAATTALSGDLKLTGADILDTNSNEFLRFTSTASAVDEITIANAAANGIVTLAATGGDAAIALSIDSKGTDALNLNGTATGDIVIGGGSGSTGCTITNSNGNLACAGDVAVNGDDITSDADLTITPAGGQVILPDGVTINVGGLANVAYNSLANAAEAPLATAIAADNDLLVTGDMEVKGGIYLSVGRNIYNTTAGGVSTGTITFPADPTAINSYNSLVNGSWLVQNSVNNGIAALMVNQTKGGDIFTASASGTTKFVIDNVGKVGIGTNDPQDFLHIIGTAAAEEGIWIDAFTSGAAGTQRPTVLGRSARGTIASPTAVQLADTLLLLGGRGYGATGYATGTTGSVIVSADENFTDSAMGTRLTFQTTPNGSTTNAERMRITNSGNVGIGSTNPLSPLHLYDSGGYISGFSTTAGAGANYGTWGVGFNVVRNGKTSSWNLGTDTYSNGGAFIDSGVGGDMRFFTVPNTGGSTQNLTDAQMMTHLTMSLTAAGYLSVPGGYGADIAENYQITDTILRGSLVSINSSSTKTAIASSIDQSSLIGVVTTKPGAVMDADGGFNVGYDTKSAYTNEKAPVALIGVVPTLVTSQNGSINSGDAIGISNIPGFGTKMSSAGQIVGKATENLDTESVCQTVTSVESINWPEDDGKNSLKPCFKLPDGTVVGKIMVAVTPSWYDPSVYLTDSGNLNIEIYTNDTNTTNKYQLTNSGTILDKIGAFGKMVAANIKAGAIITSEEVTDKLTATVATVQQLISPKVHTKLISPLADETDVTIQIGKTNEDGTSGFGKLVVQDATGSAVASIDTTGKANFNELETNEATISGTLYADDIKSKSLDEIQALLAEVKTDQDLLRDVTDWNINTATNSAQLAIADLYVTNQAAINSLSVTDSLALGSDMIFGFDNTINSLSAPLKIQSLAMAPVEIMSGLVTIDTQGNVNIAGNLLVAGRIKSSGLTLKQSSDLLSPEATESASLLNLQDANGNLVSSVNASGSAQFGSISTPQLVIAGADATVSGTIVDGTITTDSTIGKATIPAGTSEITIKNNKVTDFTMIYVTPTSSTQNNVLYVKSKENGQFKVGFTEPIDTDTSFNWWIVQVQN